MGFLDPSEADGRAPLAITLADALMFFAPGTALLLSMLLLENWVATLPIFDSASFHTPTLTITQLAQRSFQSDHWSTAVLLIVCLALMVYVIGHLINAASSLLIDRTLIYKAYGYPYEHLLGIQDPADAGHLNHGHETGSKDPIISKPYWRGLFFWINIYLTVRWFELFARSRLDLAPWSSTINVTAATIGWGIITLIGGRQVFVLIRTLRRHKRISDTPGSAEKIATKVYSKICSGAFEVAFGKPLEKLLSTRRSFDPVFCAQYRSFFTQQFALDPEKAESNNYWMSYLYVLHESPRFAAEIVHWQRLYAFSRNMSTAFYLAFLYGLSWLLFHKSVITDWQAAGITRLTVVTYSLLIISGMLLVYFYYLYVCYYSKLIFRAFVFLMKTKQGKAGM